MKIRNLMKSGVSMLAVIGLSVAVLSACGAEAEPTPAPTPADSQAVSGESVQTATNLKDAFADDFSVGVAVNPYQLSDEELSAVVTENFNSITMENQMKPESVLDQYASEASEDGMPEDRKSVV